MSPTPVSPVPEHLHTVTPRLVVRDGAGAIDFYRAAFGAEEIGDRFTAPGGELIHAEMRIGDSVVMITQDAGDADAPAKSPDSLGGSVTAIMATYWEDVDAAWRPALAAGAEVVYELADQFYGERAGRLRDPFGHQWMMSQRLGPERVA
jgi:PhnB protein